MKKINMVVNPILAKYNFRPGISKRIMIAFSVGLAISFITSLL
jgi:hypothetical protein